MLGEGCPRPQEMIRQYAEQSSAQMSSVGMLQSRAHHHHHHLHNHSHPHPPAHLSCMAPHPYSPSQTNGTLLSRKICRSQDQLLYGVNSCKICTQSGASLADPHPLHHHHALRRRRVSTPTNVKLKEWFTTINHKWARIKRQVILHHQRQQPLINEDNYGTNEEISCCHVNTIKNSSTVKPKNLKELLNSYRDDAHHLHQCTLHHLHHEPHPPNYRYTNGYGTTCYRRQQFGRWHEEPIFGSRYAFEAESCQENQHPNSVTNTPSVKVRSVASTNEPKCTSRDGDGEVENSDDQICASRPSLIKSSSIDTIANLFKDPIEEIRKFHLKQKEIANDESKKDELESSEQLTIDRVPLKRLDCGLNSNKFLQRTNSFDAVSSHCNCNCSDWLLDFDDINDPFGSLPDDDFKCSAVNSLNHGINGANNITATVNEQTNGTANDSMNELANIFAPALCPVSQTSTVIVQHNSSLLTNGFGSNPTSNDLLLCSNESKNTAILEHSNADSPGCQLNGFQSSALLNGSASQFKQFANLNARAHQRKGELVKSDNLAECSQNKALFSGTSSGSSSSSSGGNISNGSTGSGAGTCFTHRSFGTATTASLHMALNGHLSSHSTSLDLNSHLMDANFIMKCDEINHLNKKPTPPATTVTTLSAMDSQSTAAQPPALDNGVHESTANDFGQSPTTKQNELELVNGVMSCSSQPVTQHCANSLSAKPPIIDLLKEFDVCFHGNDNIDDDSSTLTDNSSHSLNSPLKRKCTTGVNGFLTTQHHLNDSLVNGAIIATSTTQNAHLHAPLTLQGSPSTSTSSPSSSSTCVHFSSVPPPTMPPPPRPTTGTLSSSSSSSIQSSNCSFSSKTLPYPTSTTSATNSLTPSKASTTPNTLGSFSRPQPPSQHQQQVPLGFDDINGAVNDILAAKPTTTFTANANQANVRQTNESNTSTATTGSQLNGQQQQQQQSTGDKWKNIELICLNEEMEEVQETIRKYRRGPICFDPRCITLKRRIGNGYFGDVFLATIPSSSNSTIINLAVKMLKSHAVPQQKAEILREAQTMAKLDHRHIVRLIGVCEGDPFMLVMELAPLGPLNKYLQNYGHNLSDDDILKLMLQVARAMQYLEEMNFVHRDLAARNILLVNERFAKVSDFGMSRALGQGKDYYKARSASKWPLKWYAPECIYYYKFSSKSDVWSYGVALWEAMSRGEMPYQGMDGQDILRMFTENRRLPKPENCPVIIYQLMWSCWQFKAEDRLKFSSISDQLSHYLNGK